MEDISTHMYTFSRSIVAFRLDFRYNFQMPMLRTDINSIQEMFFLLPNFINFISVSYEILFRSAHEYKSKRSFQAVRHTHTNTRTRTHPLSHTRTQAPIFELMPTVADKLKSLS